MQQVRRGPVKKRGSQQALLSRGIAAPRKTSTRLPVLAQARRLISRTPNTIRLGRIGSHARSKWLVLCALVLGSAVVYGAVIGGQTTRAYDALASALERSAIAAGFGVKKIALTGQVHATDAAITAALGAGPDTMMLGFDTDAAKSRLEAVPWIRHAQVMRLLPSTLQVMIEERTPFAVWQSKGRTYVVDAEGVVLAPALRDAYTDLPLVVGDGAAENAAALVAELAPHADLNKQILAAIRVGDRRWTLKLLSGAEVMLPDDNVPEALASLVKLDSERRVLERDIATVDLRLLDRITVRLRAAEATRLQDGTPQDVPTASTKSTPAKGKT
ncbi:MAG TPA: cell division protein FtsQ/DivIB [Methyloceanibacter sp.]|nr:cell division protein FtsQ/DivIB [Methyloceanibacter sp.]